MPTAQIEREPIVVLDAGGIPSKLIDCRRLHPCQSCKGVGCWRCKRTGAGPITGVCLTFCPVCSKTNRDDDPRLRLLPGETPPPNPKPPIEIADDLIGKHGGLKPMNSRQALNEQRRIARQARVAKKTARLKAKEKAAQKKAAEKARPKYLPPWKQAPPA